MKFKVAENEKTNGTSLRGTVSTTYDEIIKIFGEPTYVESDPDEKVTAEWDIEFEDGVVATIYDYKEYTGKPPLARYDWHIGGHDTKAVHHVLEALDVALPHEYTVD